MSGGGSNGAWEAGVLWGLTHYGDVEQYKYDVVTGISIGSINSALLAIWPIGNERNATEWLSETWNMRVLVHITADPSLDQCFSVHRGLSTAVTNLELAQLGGIWNQHSRSP